MNAKEHDAPQDRTPPDPELVAQLCAYLEHVIRKAEEPPVYLGKHRLLDLYIQPDVCRGSTADVMDADAAGDVVYGKRLATKPKRVSWESECELASHVAIPWRAAVLGLPGQGKSLLLMTLARQLALEGLAALRGASPGLGNVRLPVVVRLNDLANIRQKAGEPCNKYLRRALTLALRKQSPSAPEWDKAIQYIVQSTETRSVWLLLDALDEVPDPSNVLKMFPTLEKWECHVILSSHPHAYEAITLPITMTKYKLAPLSTEQSGGFLQRWFPDHERQEEVRSVLARSGHIQRMASNPLLLTLLCAFVERHGISVAITRSELYDGVLRDLLGLADDKHSTIDEQRAEAWFPLLGDLMWNTLSRDVGRPMATGELLTFIESSDHCPSVLGVAAGDLTKMSRRQQAEYLLEELRRKGILVPIDGRRSAYITLHRSFTEYLAARALSDALEGRRTLSIAGSPVTACKLWDVLDKKAWLPQWQQVLLLLAGILCNPNPLLELLNNEAHDDYFRRRLVLGALCLDELKRASLQHASAIVEAYFEYLLKSLAVAWFSLDRSMVEHHEAFSVILRRVGTPACLTFVERLIPPLVGCSELNSVCAASLLCDMGDLAATPSVLEAIPRLVELGRDNLAAVLASALGPAAKDVLAHIPKYTPPAQALPVIRRALRYERAEHWSAEKTARLGPPSCLADRRRMAAVLSVIDRPWSREELIAAIRDLWEECHDPAEIVPLVLALGETGDAEARAIEESWQARIGDYEHLEHERSLFLLERNDVSDEAFALRDISLSAAPASQPGYAPQPQAGTPATPPDNRR